MHQFLVFSFAIRSTALKESGNSRGHLKSEGIKPKSNHYGLQLVLLYDQTDNFSYRKKSWERCYIGVSECRRFDTLHLTPLSARCTKADCKCWLTREAMRYRLVFLPDLRQPPVLVVIYWRTLERQEALHRSALPLSLIKCRFKPPAHRLEVVPLTKGAPMSPARQTTTVEEGVSCETRA